MLKKHLFSQKLSNRTKRFLTLLGISLIAVSVIYRVYEASVLSFNYTPVESSVYDEQLAPTGVIIPGQDISLHVKPATIVGGTWQINKDGASHLYQSAIPGENGNIIIYAHNKDHLFKGLHDVQEGDQIQVRTGNGGLNLYIVRKKFVVNPDAIEVVQPTSHEVLTLYTCTGFGDSKRLIVQAYPTS